MSHTPATLSSSSKPLAQPDERGRLPATTPTTTTTPTPTHHRSPPRPLRGPLPIPQHVESATKLARNVSPGLLARMKFLNQQSTAEKNAVDVGRIEEDKIRSLDARFKDRSWGVERRGTAWSGLSGQPGDPLELQSTGGSSSVPPMEPGFDSDRSSVVSTSDRVLPSESEADADDVLDMQKYRLPDITKTKSLTTPTSQAPTPPLPIVTPVVSAAAPGPVPEPASEPTSKPDPAPVATPASEQVIEPAAATDTTGAPLTMTATPDALSTRPPTPPSKDIPSIQEVSVLDEHDDIDVAAYFQKRHFPRANSIYTLSKASFTNQIQQLTSMNLPPTTIASEITALPSSTLAGRALHKAANDIRLWMAKATEVLAGLDADDDVEWAAAAGREGLAEVDAAIGKFEGLVNVYISAIEDLQARLDIALLPMKDQATLVTQMEDIVGNWRKIKETLKGIKNQVEVAMEWEELWNNVLGEIGLEVENLGRLIFEMEERRHRVISDSVAEAPEKFDIAELETIVEETPRQQAKMHNNRFSMPPTLSVLSPVSPIPQIEQENSRLLALFAKLQPLRASLDFLPMRLASFNVRASSIFPSACDELLRRKEQLEEQEKRLEAEADALREELGEDKWVHSFRQAGSKAVAMYESCMKSIQRLTQAIEDNDEEKLTSRIATYKDKKDHYPPSMRRVLDLIDIEMKHRSTVNGEILRIQQDVRVKVSDLETVTRDMDAVLEDFTASRKLRDSVSTVLSARTESSVPQSIDTPNSSPASSVIISRKSSSHSTVTSTAQKSRQPSRSAAKTPIIDNRRYSNTPLSTGISYTVPRSARLGSIPSRAMTSTPTRASRIDPPTSDRPAAKPRWNSSTSMRDTVVGHNFKPMSLTPSAPHRKTSTPDKSSRSVSRQSSVPLKSPLSRSSPLPPAPPTTRPASTTPSQRRPIASLIQLPSTPAKDKMPVRSQPGSSTQISSGTPASGRRVINIEETDELPSSDESPIARRSIRPPSALNGRRVSLVPTSQRKSTPDPNVGHTSAIVSSSRSVGKLSHAEEGRTSRAGDGRSSRVGGRQSSLDTKPQWR
ncbi:hypothetical protein ACN47E_003775 [Coniothyrium glycines]